jgi:hypothetical protein
MGRLRGSPACVPPALAQGYRQVCTKLSPLALLAALGIAITTAAGELAVASALLLGLAALVVALLVLSGLAVRASR